MTDRTKRGGSAATGATPMTPKSITFIDSTMFGDDIVAAGYVVETKRDGATIRLDGVGGVYVQRRPSEPFHYFSGGVRWTIEMEPESAPRTK